MCSQRKEILLGQSSVLRGNGKALVPASFGQVLPSAAGCSHPHGHPANTAPGDLWALLDEMVL